ncbi:MAG: hypothetical protein ACE5HL_12880, partial [Terriglobia bacterium]
VDCVEPLVRRKKKFADLDGARSAAFPSGDATGKRLPLMQDFLDIVLLRALIRQAGLDGETRDFE